MPRENRQKPQPDHSLGVSEIIGAVLLISVVVAAVALVTVFLFSQTGPQNIPNVNFMTGTDSSGNLYLYHNGGDSLTRGNFSVLVDNTNYDYTISDQSNVWSLGKNLVIKGVVNPGISHSIALVYNGSVNGPVVIRSSSSSMATLQANIVPDTAYTTSSYPPVIAIPTLMQNVTNHSVIFFRERNMTIAKNSFVKFSVTKPNSTMYITPITSCTAISTSNVVKLNVGDTVTITHDDSVKQNYQISGIGDQLSELSAERVSLNITNTSGKYICTAEGLNHTWITGYTNFQSGLTLTTITPPAIGPPYPYTALTSLNYPSNRIPQYTSQIILGPNSDLIVINNASPSPIGYFDFQFDKTSNSTYMAGDALSITQAGTQKYP